MKLLSYFSFINKANITNTLYHIKTFGVRSAVEKIWNYLNLSQTYNAWMKKHLPDAAELDRQRADQTVQGPLFSIIVPVYHTPERFYRQLLDSVAAQTYPVWELCIADGSADASCPWLRELAEEYGKKNNVRYLALSENLGISGNTNAALQMASGDFIALLDHDDLLTPHALYEAAVRIRKDPEADVLYSDEDKTDIDNSMYYDPYFKPDFNLDLLRSCNYITHFFIVRKSLISRTGMFSEQLDGSQDYDFILRTAEQARKIIHIPHILYHWRIHPASVAGDPESKSYAYDAACNALQQHLDRCGQDASVSLSSHFGYYQVQYNLTEKPLISVYTRNCSEDILAQISETAGYENLEMISSLSEAKGSYILLLHDVKQILTANWVRPLLANCLRENVAAVGPKTLCSPGIVLDSGLLFTKDGRLHSPFYHLSVDSPGYCYHAMVQRSWSILGANCILLRTEDLKHYGQSSSSYENMIWELCLRLSGTGRNLVILPDIQMLCRDRRQPLPVITSCIGKNDPCYNPNFSGKLCYHLSLR